MYLSVEVENENFNVKEYQCGSLVTFKMFVAVDSR